MKRRTLLAAALAATSLTSVAWAQDLTVGVSWSNFQEERWKTDEAAIKAALEAAGATYISADAQSSAAKQLSDIESLIAQGVDALIILAQDASAIGPAVQAAADEGIPVVAYDRLIEDPRAFYLTFDNVEVGRMQARAVLEAAPEGNYVMIKGSPQDPNADFLRGGQQEVLQEAIDAGDITIVGEAYTDGWLPANAQRNMEQILTANDNNVDAVVASNDGTAGGVVAALTAQGMQGIPVSGQDGDHAALNRVAGDADRLGLEGRARARQGRGRDRRGAGGRHRDGRDPEPGRVHDARRQRDELGLPRADADHAGQPVLVVDAGWIPLRRRSARACPAARRRATDLRRARACGPASRSRRMRP
jgi:D-xylose transport system substrate-binding protein